MHDTLINTALGTIARDARLSEERKRMMAARLMAVRDNLCAQPDCWRRCACRCSSAGALADR